MCVRADGSLDQGVGHALVGERIAIAVRGAEGALGCRIGRQRILGQGHAFLDVKTALAPPTAQQRVEEGDGARALGIVAVPDRVAAGVNQRRRRAGGHCARRRADQRRFDAGFQVHPLRRIARNVRTQLLESGGIALDVVLVVEPLVDQHVHPRQQQGDVGARLDRQPVFRFSRRHREARIDGDQRRVVAQGGRQRLHLRVVQVLADVRTDQHDAARVFHVGPLGRPQAFAERQLKTDVARTAALGEGRFGIAAAAEGAHKVFEVTGADTVVEQCRAVGTVLFGDRLEAPGDMVQRLVPRHFLESLAAVRAGHAQQRFLQPVAVLVAAQAAGSARAQTPFAVQVLVVAGDLPRLIVFGFDERGALPETHVAEGRRAADLPLPRQRVRGAAAEQQRRRQTADAEQAGYLDEFAPVQATPPPLSIPRLRHASARAPGPAVRRAPRPRRPGSPAFPPPRPPSG